MWLFVGLGNPGPTYEKTRHNIGFRVIDAMRARTGARDISKKSFQGELYRQGNLFFLKPTTFMNLSGNSVAPVLHFFKIPLEHLVVIHDDIDLKFGEIRLKRGGGNGGHNGLKSIDAAVGRDYIRLRMGVGKPKHKSQVVDYVLQPFTPVEEEKVPCLVDYAAELALRIPHKSLEELKSRYTLKATDDPCAN